MTKAAVHSVETFGSVDGPGIRFIIFLKGCKLRCRYCHNPDTWNPDSKDMRSADELLEQALKYRTYWGKKGGITVSGGEALLQMDFMIERPKSLEFIPALTPQHSHLQEKSLSLVSLMS